MSIAEMRASTLAARALSLEPRYTRVPCVGGTEGETLVPLFSKAVEFFDFARVISHLYPVFNNTSTISTIQTYSKGNLESNGLILPMVNVKTARDFPKPYKRSR